MSLIDLVISPREADIGFKVQRLLPYVHRRMVGPFIFLDHMGPAHFTQGQGINVRPHPHIGLATVTYLFSGEIFHRDSVGSAQAIKPGDVNWMTAGAGITHSERTLDHELARPHDLHGLQSWVAIPKEFEDCEPEFFHHEATTLPVEKSAGVQLRVIAGEAFGHRAPVKILSPLFYVDAHFAAGGRLDLAADYTERAVYVIDGDVRVGGTQVSPSTMAVLTPGDMARIEAASHSHVMLLGGEPFAEPRYINWNFVSSDPDKIVAAKEAWQNQTFAKVPGDDQEFIPLP